MEEKCQVVFSDQDHVKIHCTVHDGEAEKLKPATRKQVLRMLVADGRWKGAPPSELQSPTRSDTNCPTCRHLMARHVDGVCVVDYCHCGAPAASEATAPTPESKPTAFALTPDDTPAPTNVQRRDIVTYRSYEGQEVELTIRAFRALLCDQANQEQAFFGLQWCKHNKIDPWSGEAVFSVMDGKLVPQVTKDCWYKRMEGHPRFEWERGGLIVDTSLTILRDAVVSGDESYVLSEILKKRLIDSFLQGKVIASKGISERLEIKKLDLHIRNGETLTHGWSEIKMGHREQPYYLSVDVEGWSNKKRSGEDNIFWSRKAAFMIRKTARKNNIRQAMPELSGLLNQREAPDDFDVASAADYELSHNARIQRLHGIGAKVAAPRTQAKGLSPPGGRGGAFRDEGMRRHFRRCLIEWPY